MNTHISPVTTRTHFQVTPARTSRRRRKLAKSSLAATGFVFFIILGVVFTTSVLASRGSNSASVSKINASAGAAFVNPRRAQWLATVRNGWSIFAPVPPPLIVENIQTFEVVGGLCTNTPKDTFVLGDKVCAKSTNSPLRPGAPLRRINSNDPKGFVRDSADVNSDPQEAIFTLPSNNTSSIDGVPIDNRGTWSVSANDTDSGTRAIAYYNVSDPDNVAADLVVYNFSQNQDAVTPGSNTSFHLWLNNSGPDAAADVHATMAVPSSLTYTSASTTSAFVCAENAGVIDCSLASWASGEIANITLNFGVGGASPNAVVSTTANITSNTNDPRPESNSSQANVEIRTEGAPPATCSLGCPGDVVVTATSSSGAVVNFSAADIEVSGDCGSVQFSPASGSVFPVGTSSVSVSSTAGGGSCSFTVTVVDTPGPTISCPGDQAALAASGQAEADVTTGTATATGTGVAVTSVRSDNRDLSDPYPIGTTHITWTATDSTHRTASCVQNVVVTSVDAPTISCPANKTFDAGGDCEKTLTAGDIGTPTTGGLSPTITSRRSDDKPLTDPYPVGQTVITWTNTNSLGSVSCTQLITITATGDTTPPALTVPADVTVNTNTCSALVDDELGSATATDSCSTVAISRTGVPSVACPIPGNPTRTCETFVFPVGTTDVTYTATDGAGNSSSGVQHVTVLENTPPSFVFVPPNLGPIYTGPGAMSCGVVVSDAELGTAIVSDNCDTTVIRTGVPAGNNFPVGTTIITYKAKANPSVTRTQTVTVVDNTAPVVTPPAAVTLYTGAGATSCGVTVANLDTTLGTGSATDNCPGVGVVARSGVPAGNNFPVGTTTVTYSATDAGGNTGSATQTVTVIDNTVPVITTNGQTLSMWPPNHKYSTFQLTQFVTGASDNCGSVSINDVVIEKVTSDEIENGNGDGNTLNDIVIAANCKSVQLRAEREGSGNGRVYTITFKVTDSHGNVGRATAKVVVPHNPGETVVDSGAQYTVNGTCP